MIYYRVVKKSVREMEEFIETECVHHIIEIIQKHDMRYNILEYLEIVMDIMLYPMRVVKMSRHQFISRIYSQLYSNKKVFIYGHKIY